MARILTQRDIEALLPMETCIDLMADVLAALARGEAQNPLRTALLMPDRSGLLGMMPASVAPIHALGIKVVGVFKANHGTELDAHQGVVLLLDDATGEVRAILEAGSLTAIRTAAASGLATRLLAREDAGDLAILGSGVQASAHLAAMACARPLRRVRVFSPTEERRRAFAERESARHGLEVEAVDSAHDAVHGADIVCTVTSSREPVVQGEWLAPGVHVNAAGSSIRTTRELDTEAVRRARLFVDKRESTLNEAGDFLFPMREGAIDESHVLGEIGELVLGDVEGRTGPDEITLFKSLGIAVEDMAAATHVLERAEAEGVGVEVDLTGRAPGHGV